MYLSYQEYQSMGGTLEETTFNDIEFEAEAYVNWVTFNRLKKDTEYPEALKRCMYALIRLVQNKIAALTPQQGGSQGGTTLGVASQSNDGVSISYNVMSAKDIMQESTAEMRKTVDMYLQDVTNELGQKLLYRGLYPDE